MSDLIEKTEMDLEISEIDEKELLQTAAPKRNINVLDDVPVTICAKLGKTFMSIEKVLEMHTGQIIPLNANVGDPIELYANNVLIGFGEVVIVNECIGIKITKINVKDAVNRLCDSIKKDID